MHPKVLVLLKDEESDSNIKWYTDSTSTLINFLKNSRMKIASGCCKLSTIKELSSEKLLSQELWLFPGLNYMGVVFMIYQCVKILTVAFKKHLSVRLGWGFEVLSKHLQAAVDTTWGRCPNRPMGRSTPAWDIRPILH